MELGKNHDGREVRRMAKMLVVQLGYETADGERVVDVFDMQRATSRGELYCVSRAIPENMAQIEWKEYESRPVNRRKERSLS